MSTLSRPVPFELLESVFRDAVGAVADAGVDFAMAGSFAMWAHGAAEPPMVEDVDLAMRKQDLPIAARALRDAGFRIEVPPHGWLIKAFHSASNDCGEFLFVDLIHDLVGMPVDDAMLARAPRSYLDAVSVKALAPIDILTGNLRVLAPSYLDYTNIVQHARFLRSDFDWDELEQRVADHPPAMAFFDLCARLGIDPRKPSPEEALSHQPARFASRLDEGIRAELHALAER